MTYRPFKNTAYEVGNFDLLPAAETPGAWPEMSHNGRLLRDSLLLCQMGPEKGFPGFLWVSSPDSCLYGSLGYAGNHPLVGACRSLSLAFGHGEPTPWEVLVRSQCLGLYRKQLRGRGLAGPLMGSLLRGLWEGLISFQKHIFVLPSHQWASVSGFTSSRFHCRGRTNSPVSRHLSSLLQR